MQLLVAVAGTGGAVVDSTSSKMPWAHSPRGPLQIAAHKTPTKSPLRLVAEVGLFAVPDFVVEAAVAAEAASGKWNPSTLPGLAVAVGRTMPTLQTTSFRRKTVHHLVEAAVVGFGIILLVAVAAVGSLVDFLLLAAIFAHMTYL